MFEAVLFGTFLLCVPLLLIICIIYACFILGYTALIGILVYLVFLPIQVWWSFLFCVTQFQDLHFIFTRLSNILYFPCLFVCACYSSQLPGWLVCSEGGLYLWQTDVFAQWMRFWPASSSLRCMRGRSLLRKLSQVAYPSIHPIVFYSWLCEMLCFFSFLSPILSLFFSDIDIRKNEKLLLQKAGYVQSLNSSLTTIVPTLATILTFIVHTALKLPLQPSTVSAKKGL